MPRKKVIVAEEQPQEPVQESVQESVAPDVHPVPPQEETVSVPKTFPAYEGKQVVEILEENVNGQWHHCKLSDGTTAHVPVNLFD